MNENFNPENERKSKLDGFDFIQSMLDSLNAGDLFTEDEIEALKTAYKQLKIRHRLEKISYDEDVLRELQSPSTFTAKDLSKLLERQKQEIDTFRDLLLDKLLRLPGKLDKDDSRIKNEIKFDIEPKIDLKNVIYPEKFTLPKDWEFNNIRNDNDLPSNVPPKFIDINPLDLTEDKNPEDEP